ncbi:MAG TPA: hypothetical protein VFN49_12500 [Candidatus Aquilonibacter sp.]|nr:hypothetical protein [Candidatus Aquilonibacter sp.]
MKIRLASLALALITIAASPAPKPAPHAPFKPQLPKMAMHTEFLVEVNSRGQVVRVKSGKSAKQCTKQTEQQCLFFNAQTYGNVLQMWIRHPDGTAEVGMYRVTYDYDPKTHNVRRNVAIVSRGGNWGNTPGAATDMMDKAQAEAKAWAEKQKMESKDLPDLNKIVSPKPTHKP